MGVLAAGVVVVVPFPFSDLSQSKLRPVVVLADAGRGDFILCQITSNPYGDAMAQQLSKADFASGALRMTSYVRPGKLFTAHRSLVQAEIGVLVPDSFRKIRDAVAALFK